MPEITKYAPGAFCWSELGTSDPDAAKNFYKQVFGWAANDIPAGPDMVYTMLSKDGKDVGALYKLKDEHKAMGIPPHWLSYISVESADETAKKAKELGGTVEMEPFDVFDVGRMAVIQDPTGATFAIWQPRSSIGAKVRDETNTLCWNELNTNDTGKALEFYTKLFGWTSKTDDNSTTPYTEFMNAGTPHGGMIQIAPEWGKVPPHWLLYFAVDDCDGTVGKATGVGASTVLPPTDIPNVGRFALIADPQGAMFAVIKLEARS
jgi:predicted enzyme related to lactoylglutathione lyase